MRRPGSLAEVLRHHGSAHPDAPALTWCGATQTFGDLDQRSNQVAQALAAEGIGVGDRIAYLDKNTPAYFELLFAAAKLNAVMVPVNWRLAGPEIAYIVDHSTATVLVVGREFRDVVRSIEPALDRVKKVIVLGADENDEYHDWSSPSGATIDPGFVPGPDDVAVQLYTSGTTGLPKGVMLTNRNLFADLLPTAATEWQFDAASVNLVAMPVFHVAGSGYAAVGFLAGCETLLHREVDAADLLRAIEDARVTNFLAVPAVLQLMLDEPDVDSRDLGSLRTVVYGASPISERVLSKAICTFGCDFIQAYGLTETAGAVVALMPPDHDPDGPKAHLLRAAGRPMKGVELRVVSAAGVDVPVGEVGEIWVRTSQNMKGYWRQPQETEKTITADGWLKTGDAGYLNEDGYLFIHDRVKDMIISGGENVYPAEVENVLMAHPAVADVAVIGVPSQRWGETAKALVVLGSHSTPTEDELIAFTRERLARYKCPTSVDFVSDLPRNPSGKILKRQLRAPFWESHDRDVN